MYNPMKTFALTNAVIYTGEKILYDYAVIIEQEQIKAIIRQSQLPPTLHQIDLQGANLTAGFIDLQLNGCGGVMFNDQTSVETLEIMQETNLKSGTTAFLPTFITAPDTEMKQAIKVMREFAAKHHTGKQFKNQALGLHLEGPYLSLTRKGVHRPEYIREISAEMLEFLCQNADIITKITLAAENPTARHIPQFVEQGIIVSIGHSDADYATAKAAIKAGASFATHLHNAMSPISSGRELGVVGAVLESEIYCGIIADGMHVDYANLRIDKAAKKEKLCLVTDATAAAGAEIDHFQFVGKTVYVKNGKCYDANGTLGGSSVTMIESIKNCVNEANIPLDEALRMANLYPAKAIKVDAQMGSISAGKVANLTAFNHQFEVTACWVGGELKYQK
ncbi:N-acetylglucosamine-6-phosphate deacetylase [Mergibacter septicus]|uniref:N-acetylglucosamine-6-phosphate deacetylase n=1 Tax=Mergibacter septicus TaxID=221402 RepID=UPI0039057ECC